MSDEVHQMFVPTRTAYLGDIFMDGVGAGIGLLFAIIIYTSLSLAYPIRRIKRIRGERDQKARSSNRRLVDKKDVW